MRKGKVLSNLIYNACFKPVHILEIVVTLIVTFVGKAQGQLAVLAAYSENDLDIVYWDTFR